MLCLVRHHTINFLCLCCKLLFWSKTHDLVHSYSAATRSFWTLEDTLVGYMFNDLIWCGKEERDRGTVRYTTHKLHWSGLLAAATQIYSFFKMRILTYTYRTDCKNFGERLILLLLLLFTRIQFQCLSWVVWLREPPSLFSLEAGITKCEWH